MNLKEMNLVNKTVTMDLGEFKNLIRLAEIGKNAEKKEKSETPMSVDQEIFCTNCYSCLVGEWDDEDNYNIFYKYCPECGQAISQNIDESEGLR